ncbi:hypothetical protein [Ferrimonas aestuarii]|nr:hypothetical protein [Ferrimonas aestuarii]
MKELSYEDLREVQGGFVQILAGVIAVYYGEKAGSWLYKKIFG